VTSALAVPGGSRAPEQHSGGQRVEVLGPRPGAPLWNAGKKAAARAKVSALVRVTGGPVAYLSVRLNGHAMRGVATRSRQHRVLLSKKNGLTIGYNVLRGET
jgi:hypothetical protein